MLCLIPHLFPSGRFLETAIQGLRLPALEMLLARGKRRDSPADGVEAALCAVLGISRQQDWPVAPTTLEADGGIAGEAYWLRADPVHLRLMRDRIVLTDNRMLDLSRQEAEALSAAIGAHFGESMSPLASHPQRWYIQTHRTPRLLTTPLSIAIGRAVDALLPQGADASGYRTLLNEAQMLLHAHPVNQSREARGALPANALWLWGGGRKPAIPAVRATLYTRDDEARALGNSRSARIMPLPATLDASLFEANGAILLDDLTAAGQNGDAYGWREAIRALEANWFEPLSGTLHAIGPGGLQVCDPVNGKTLHLQRTDAWKIWRRARGLVSLRT